MSKAKIKLFFIFCALLSWSFHNGQNGNNNRKPSSIDYVENGSCIKRTYSFIDPKSSYHQLGSFNKWQEDINRFTASLKRSDLEITVERDIGGEVNIWFAFWGQDGKELLSANIYPDVGELEIAWVEGSGWLYRLAEIQQICQQLQMKVQKIRGYLTDKVLQLYRNGDLDISRLKRSINYKLMGNWEVRVKPFGERVYVIFERE